MATAKKTTKKTAKKETRNIVTPKWKEFQEVVTGLPQITAHPMPPDAGEQSPAFYIRMSSEFEESSWFAVMSNIFQNTDGVDISKRYLPFDKVNPNAGIGHLWRIAKRMDFALDVEINILSSMLRNGVSVVDLTEVPMAQDQRVDRNLATSPTGRGITNRVPK